MDYRVSRSWATEQEFYTAPFPEHTEWSPGDYQHAGVEYRIGSRHGLFGDAPGVGKTAECILTGNALGAKRTLVLCPASLRLNWEKEVWMWSTKENVSTYPILASRDGVSLEHDYVIASYNALQNDGIFDALMSGFWDHLILDEAHYLKDPNGNTRTARTVGNRDVDGITTRVGSITAATGTPMPNQPIEIYNMARMCDWDSIDRMSLEDFRDYYYEEGWGWIVGPVTAYQDPENQLGEYEVIKRHRALVRNIPRRLDELQKRLRSTFMVRRLKEHVLPQLPPKQWHPFPIEGNSDLRRAMKSEAWKAAEKLYELDPGVFDTSIPIDGDLSTVRKEVGIAKAPMVLDYVKQLLEEGTECLIVSAWHHDVLDYLRDGLKKYGLVYMDGTTTARNKQKFVDDFQNNEKIRVGLGQQLPLMLGHTLTRAMDAVLAEFDWVPGNNDQLLDRLHRRGQKGHRIVGHVPYVKGTLEEKILGRAIEKDISIYAALDEDAEHNPRSR
tara:strand:- start:494 stop:1990 length:1497 start_codon:yes stop_codon:yes gene_type:complete